MGRGRRDKEIHIDEAGELPIGVRMRQARRDKNISLTLMAEKTALLDQHGFSISYLSTVEHGKALPSFKLAEIYEQLLELEKGELTQYLLQERRASKQNQNLEDEKAEPE